jgi:hypothetical protein
LKHFSEEGFGRTLRSIARAALLHRYQAAIVKIAEVTGLVWLVASLNGA